MPLNDWDVSNVNDMHCSEKSHLIDINNWDVSNANDMSNMFQEQNHLIRILIIGMLVMLTICLIFFIMQYHDNQYIRN